MNKLVNGVLVPMTPEEQAQHQQDSVAYEAAHADKCKTQIDLLADQRRASFVSPGALIDQEYALVAAEAKAYAANGYMAPVPTSVSVWAQLNNVPNKQAADAILAQRDLLNAELNRIRAIRLRKKAAIDAAVSISDCDAIVEEARAELFV